MIALLALLLAVVNSPNSSVSYACDGVTATYSINFPYLAYTDLVVTTTTAPGVVTTLVYTTDYTVNLASTSSTATLTLNVPATKCPAGNTFKISRVVAYTQPSSFKAQTNYNQNLHEQVADRLAMQIQQLATILPTATALGLQDEGVALGNIATLNCVGPGFTCTALVGVGSATVSVAAPLQIPNTGNTNDVGTANTLARSDHVHALAVGPMLGANTTAAQSIPNTGTLTIVVFGTVERDTDSAYNSGTGRYTIPTGKGGDYVITGYVAWSAAATSAFIQIFKNGASVKQIASTGTGGVVPANGVQGGSCILNLAAGDVIDFRAAHSSGGAVTLTAAATNNFFAIKRVQ